MRGKQSFLTAFSVIILEKITAHRAYASVISAEKATSYYSATFTGRLTHLFLWRYLVIPPLLFIFQAKHTFKSSGSTQFVLL